MSTIPVDDVPLDPFSVGGTELVSRINRIESAYHSGQLSAARPPLCSIGGVWSRANSDGTHSLMVYDGTSDSVVDTFGEDAAPKPTLDQMAPGYSPAGSYSQGQVVFNAGTGKFEQAKVPVAPGPYNPSQWLRLGAFRDAFQPYPLPLPDLPGRVFVEYAISAAQIAGYQGASGATIHRASGHAIFFGAETGSGRRNGMVVLFVEASFVGPPASAEIFSWTPPLPAGQLVTGIAQPIMQVTRRQSNGMIDQWVGAFGTISASKVAAFTTEMNFKPRTVHDHCQFVFEAPMAIHVQ